MLVILITAILIIILIKYLFDYIYDDYSKNKTIEKQNKQEETFDTILSSISEDSCNNTCKSNYSDNNSMVSFSPKYNKYDYSNIVANDLENNHPYYLNDYKNGDITKYTEAKTLDIPMKTIDEHNDDFYGFNNIINTSSHQVYDPVDKMNAMLLKRELRPNTKIRNIYDGMTSTY